MSLVLISKSEQRKPRLRVLVSGSRSGVAPEHVEARLSRIGAKRPLVVIHGGAAGVDRAASVWATRSGHQQQVYQADWARHGRGAGPMRNQRMLDEAAPDLVLAFRNEGRSRGTDDMVRRAKKAGVPTVVYVNGKPRRRR